jgi:hypothetical protein
MALTALEPQPEPTATQRSDERREIGSKASGTVFPLHEQSRVSVTVVRQFRFRNKIPSAGVLRRPFENDRWPWGTYNISQRVLI